MKNFMTMEMSKSTEMEVVIGDEGIDERCAFIKWKVESGKWKVKVVVEFFGEGWGECGLGGGGNKSPLLEIEEGFTEGVVVEGLDTEVTGDSEKECDGEVRGER